MKGFQARFLGSPFPVKEECGVLWRWLCPLQLASLDPHGAVQFCELPRLFFAEKRSGGTWHQPGNSEFGGCRLCGWKGRGKGGVAGAAPDHGLKLVRGNESR